MKCSGAIAITLFMGLVGSTWAADVMPTTDDARAEAAKRNAAAERASSLQALPPLKPDAFRITDTDSAREAAAQINARLSHEAHLAEVLRAGAGSKAAQIVVTDTDSARAAAGQKNREQVLLSEYAEYVRMQAQACFEPGRVSN